MDETHTITHDTTTARTVVPTTSTTSTAVNTASTVSNNVVSPALMNESYYHGYLPREDVHHLLKNNGDFLVRVSQPKAGDTERQIIISVLADKDEKINIGMRHVVVRRSEGKYTVESDSPKFDSIQSLIEHYQKSGKTVLPSVEAAILITPIGRQKWELRHCDIELTKRLGHGVYGEVHKGKMKRKNHHVDVAVKLAKSTALTKERVKDMMREARMMRNYQHPNVVRIYGVAFDEEPLLIVMELVRGGSLEDYLRKKAGKIDDVEKLNCMASGAAWGIDYLHSRSCIHRDIASRNCLYDKSKVVKISDFGLSRQGEKYKMTKTQKIPIKWIAPGVLLWEIFTDGAEPFEGKKTAEIKSLLLNGVRLEFPPSTPPDIKELVVGGMWNSRPEDRISMSQIVQRLEQLTGVKQPVHKRSKHHHHSDHGDERNVNFDSNARKNQRSRREEAQSNGKHRSGNNSIASKYQRSISQNSTATAVGSVMPQPNTQQDL